MYSIKGIRVWQLNSRERDLAQKRSPGSKYYLSGFVLYLDGRQLGGRCGLIAVAVTCFDAEALTLSASSNFYFVRS